MKINKQKQCLTTPKRRKLASLIALDASLKSGLTPVTNQGLRTMLRSTI